MSKIYIPELEEGNCVVIRSAEVIRVYDSRPTLNSEVHYRDYYPNLNYAYNEGYQTFGNYSSSIPVCSTAVSSNIKYYPGFDSIILLILIAFGISIIIINDLIKELL